MNKTVVALYNDFTAANNAVRELVENGFARDDISVVSPERTGEYAGELAGHTRTQTATGAGAGAGIGAAVGGIGGALLGLGALFIPGVGPVLAAGPLVSLLASAGIGAAVGGVTGGLLGALVDMDIPEESAHRYAEGVRRGGSLVTVKTTEERSSQAVQILNRYDPVNVDQRVDEWRQAGWTGFASDSEPYQTDGKDWPQKTTSAFHSEDLDADDMSDETDMEDDDYAYPSTYQGFDEYEPTFRNHFETGMYRDTYRYDEFRPAYYYGYTLATDDRYRDRNWDALEPEARRYWDERQPGAWERFKDTIRDAWDEIRIPVT